VYNTYIIKNEEGKLYIGQTNNLEKRLTKHNANKSIYTRNKGPWELIFYKSFGSRKDAVEFERLLKKTERR